MKHTSTIGLLALIVTLTGCDNEFDRAALIHLVSIRAEVASLYSTLGGGTDDQDESIATLNATLEKLTDGAREAKRKTLAAQLSMTAVMFKRHIKRWKEGGRNWNDEKINYNRRSLLEMIDAASQICSNE